MSEKAKQDSDMRDADLAARERPVPSQAEGELETVEQDLREKDKSNAKTVSPGSEQS